MTLKGRFRVRDDITTAATLVPLSTMVAYALGAPTWVYGVGGFITAFTISVFILPSLDIWERDEAKKEEL